MPVTSLFSLFRSRGWGRQSEQQLDVLYLGANSSTTATVTPSAPYNGMVVHLITFHRLLPGAWKVTVSQREVGVHTVQLSSDLADVSFWAWITEADPLLVTVQNRTSWPGYLGATLATINFDTLEQMRSIRSQATEEFGLSEGTLTPGPAEESARRG